MAWQCTQRAMIVECAVSLQVRLRSRLAPAHIDDDQFVIRGNSDFACMEAVAVHTVHSVANTQTRGRWARRRRTAIVRSNACCSSICAAACHRRLQEPDNENIGPCHVVYDRSYLHSRSYAAALNVPKRNNQAMSTPVPSST